MKQPMRPSISGRLRPATTVPRTMSVCPVHLCRVMASAVIKTMNVVPSSPWASLTMSWRSRSGKSTASRAALAADGSEAIGSVGSTVSSGAPANLSRQ